MSTSSLRPQEVAMAHRSGVRGYRRVQQGQPAVEHVWTSAIRWSHVMADRNAGTFQCDNCGRKLTRAVQAVGGPTPADALEKRPPRLVVVAEDRRGRELVTHPARIRLRRLGCRSHTPGVLG